MFDRWETWVEFGEWIETHKKRQEIIDILAGKSKSNHEKKWYFSNLKSLVKFHREVKGEEKSVISEKVFINKRIQQGGLAQCEHANMLHSLRKHKQNLVKV